MYYTDDRDDSFYWGRTAEPPAERVCVCPEYHGTTKVAWCEACNDYTDNIEIKMADAQAAAVAAVAPRIPADVARIGNGLYVSTRRRRA